MIELYRLLKIFSLYKSPGFDSNLPWMFGYWQVYLSTSFSLYKSPEFNSILSWMLQFRKHYWHSTIFQWKGGELIVFISTYFSFILSVLRHWKKSLTFMLARLNERSLYGKISSRCGYSYSSVAHDVWVVLQKPITRVRVSTKCDKLCCSHLFM